MSQITDYFSKKGSFGSLLTTVEYGQLILLASSGWHKNPDQFVWAKICLFTNTVLEQMIYFLQWKLVLGMKMEKEKMQIDCLD